MEFGVPEGSQGLKRWSTVHGSTGGMVKCGKVVVASDTGSYM